MPSTLHSDNFNHIIGQGFAKTVQKAISNKQKLMATKNRNHNIYFHNNSPWIKLASSVRVVGNQGKAKLISSDLSPTLIGSSLALNFYLFSEVKGGKVQQISVEENLTALRNSDVDLPPGFDDNYFDTEIENSGDNLAYTKFSTLGKNIGINARGAGRYNSTYGFAGLDFGLKPLPGITDLTVETLGSNGSLKKATLKIKAFNKQQFNIIELLYLRLGYHVLVEFGNRLYLNSSGSPRTVGNTLLETDWFGDENFVDVNDPDLAALNEEILGAQDELTLLEDDNEEAQARLDVRNADILRAATSRNDIDDLTSEELQEAAENYYDGDIELSTREQNLLNGSRLGINAERSENYGGSNAEALAARVEFFEDKIDDNEDWGLLGDINLWGSATYDNLERTQALQRRYAAVEDAIEVAKTLQEQQEERQGEIDSLTEKISELRQSVAESLDDFLDNLNKRINSFRTQYNYDYDGMIGKVTNFNWSLDKNGVYDITVEIFSAGDVLQSLAINNRNSPEGPYEITADREGSNPLNITKEAGDIINALNNLGTLAREYKAKEDEEELARQQISAADLAAVTGEVLDEEDPESVPITVAEGTTEESLNRANYLELEKGAAGNSFMNGYAKVGSKAANLSPLIYLNRIDTIVRLVQDIEGASIGGFGTVGEADYTPDNSYTTSAGYEVVKVKAQGVDVSGNAYFIRLGFYLKLLQAITFPKFSGQGRLGKPMLRILTEGGKYPFFKNDLLVSSRPSVCVIRTSCNVLGFLDSQDELLYIPEDIISDPVFECMQAAPGREFFANVNYKVDGVNYGDIMNIYLNMDYLAKILLDSDTDEFGETNFLQHMAKLCKDINDSFGNITNIDFKVDEDRNICYFLDKKIQPGVDGLLDKYGKAKNSFVFNVNGFYNSQNIGLIGTIVRDFNLKSTIPPNLATMITVGSNQIQQGHTGRTDATAFSLWNKGLQDKVLPVKFIEGYDPQYRNGVPTITTIKKRNIIYQKYFSQIGNLYSAEVATDDTENTVTTRRFALIFTFKNEERVVSTSTNLVNGINLTAESGVMELQRKAVAIPQSTSAIEDGVPAPTGGFLPIDLQLTFNGTSGIKIFETYTVPTRFLPRSYPDSLTFICKKLTQTVNDKGWLTKIQSFSLPSPQSANTAKSYYTRVDNLSPSYQASAPTTTRGGFGGGVFGGSGGGGGGGFSGLPGFTSIPLPASVPSAGSYRANFIDCYKKFFHSPISETAVMSYRGGTTNRSCAAHIAAGHYWTAYLYYGPKSEFPVGVRLTEEEVNAHFNNRLSINCSTEGVPGKGYSVLVNCWGQLGTYLGPEERKVLPFTNYAKDPNWKENLKNIQVGDIGFNWLDPDDMRPGHVWVASKPGNTDGTGVITVWDQHRGAWQPGYANGNPRENGTKTYNNQVGYVFRLTDDWWELQLKNIGISQSRINQLLKRSSGNNNVFVPIPEGTNTSTNVTANNNLVLDPIAFQNNPLPVYTPENEFLNSSNIANNNLTISDEIVNSY